MFVPTFFYCVGVTDTSAVWFGVIFFCLTCILLIHVCFSFFFGYSVKHCPPPPNPMSVSSWHDGIISRFIFNFHVNKELTTSSQQNKKRNFENERERFGKWKKNTSVYIGRVDDVCGRYTLLCIYACTEVCVFVIEF